MYGPLELYNLSFYAVEGTVVLYGNPIVHSHFFQLTQLALFQIAKYLSFFCDLLMLFIAYAIDVMI
jgi:hypothetical protein